MSMSTHVVGFRPADEQWRKMKAVWDACVAADTPVPREVEMFFGGQAPDAAGIEVDFYELRLLREWSDDSRRGYELDVERIPPGVTRLRFYNSW